MDAPRIFAPGSCPPRWHLTRHFQTPFTGRFLQLRKNATNSSFHSAATTSVFVNFCRFFSTLR
ncbi:hypothetical protein D7S44_10625 [Pantoea piersonii]|jgi:hypothetical protein|nr:hypothetical protein D7S44_10625 [Pantoea piersonii]